MHYAVYRSKSTIREKNKAVNNLDLPVNRECTPTHGATGVQCAITVGNPFEVGCVLICAFLCSKIYTNKDAFTVVCSEMYLHSHAHCSLAVCAEDILTKMHLQEYEVNYKECE